MRIELKPGETLEVGFFEGDGTFTFEFDTTVAPNAIKVSVDLPGNMVGEEGVIYHEQFDDEGDETDKPLPIE